MTRRDYELIAEVLRSTRPTDVRATSEEYNGAMQAWKNVVHLMLGALARESDKFDARKFMEAVGG